MNFKKLCIQLSIVGGLCLSLTSCTSKSLKDQRAEQQIEYILLPETHIEVVDGVATFTGTFPDEASRDEAERTAKGIKGIKSVINNATIASSSPEVQLTSDTTATTSTP
ncbi:BON domain-containing protein [Olivibacter sp. SDN3]|uniref:BON domain-containing protein n=1 Tax=Olivibacter sp. SDN3 TaxID=2764720 RepID=UPI00165120A9|nr:BON domain-containing protein [Olivibacter sp. SDN3]QNL50127.1 BON domain-containing protein [Olivibacter sp. SDN3]